MDAVSLLIGPLISVVVPHLPRLLQLGQSVADDAAQDLQDTGWSLAKRMWSAMRPHVEAKPAAKEAAENVSNDPSDQDSVAALRSQFRKLLTDDPSLRETIAALVREGEQNGVVRVTASGERSVAIGGNVSGTIVTGDSNRISL